MEGGKGGKNDGRKKGREGRWKEEREGKMTEGGKGGRKGRTPADGSENATPTPAPTEESDPQELQADD